MNPRAETNHDDILQVLLKVTDVIVAFADQASRMEKKLDKLQKEVEDMKIRWE